MAYPSKLALPLLCCLAIACGSSEPALQTGPSPREEAPVEPGPMSHAEQPGTAITGELGASAPTVRRAEPTPAELNESEPLAAEAEQAAEARRDRSARRAAELREARAQRERELAAAVAAFPQAVPFDSLVSPSRLIPARGAQRRAAIRAVRQASGLRGRVIGVLPNGTVAVAITHPQEVTRDQWGERVEDEACTRTEIVGVADGEVVGGLEGVCIDGEEGELLMGDIDGDDEPELVVRSTHVLYTGLDARDGPGQRLGTVQRTIIANDRFEPRVEVRTSQDSIDDREMGSRHRHRVRFVDMNGDGHIDMLTWTVSAESLGCENVDLWEQLEARRGQPAPPEPDYDEDIDEETEETSRVCVPGETYEVRLMDPQTRTWGRPQHLR